MATVHMTAKKQVTLQDIQRKLRDIKGIEPVSHFSRTIHDVRILTLVYEKHYLRTRGYTTATVALTEFGEDQTVCVITSGGGEGIYNYSYGANRSLAKECICVLQSCGFTAVDSDLETKGKSFAERFLE